MNSAVPLRVLGTAALLFQLGCATAIETPLRKPQPQPAPSPLRVGVLPPRIHPSLTAAHFKSDTPLYQQLLDGRGITVTSPDATNDIALEIVSTLTQANTYQRIFTVQNEDEARQLGADALLTVTVWDYRTVQLGANYLYPVVTLLGPLMSQYWVRWRTLEARLEWEVKLTSLTDGSTLYRNRLKRAYTSSVRSASGHHFTDKMLSFLQTRATPDFISELFALETAPSPK